MTPSDPQSPTYPGGGQALLLSTKGWSLLGAVVWGSRGSAGLVLPNFQCQGSRKSSGKGIPKSSGNGIPKSSGNGILELALLCSAGEAMWVLKEFPHGLLEVQVVAKQ